MNSRASAILTAIKRWKSLRLIGVRVGEPFTALVAAIAWETDRSYAGRYLAAMAAHGLVSRSGDGTWRLERRA